MFWWRASLLLALANPVLAGPVTLPARAVSYQPEHHAWARVEATAPLVLRTATAARIVQVRVVPGQVVAAGQVLATLGGPQFDGEFATARVQAKTTRQILASARRVVASVLRTYPVTSNRQTLEAAQSALDEAEGRWAAAHAALATIEAQADLRSPAAATVGSIEAAPGADMLAGAPVLTVLPHGQLWLRAESFVEAAPGGTIGHFEPSDGSSSVKVRLIAELPARATNGAHVLNFRPVTSAPWQAGESGEVTWSGRPVSAVSVPAQSLILDAGKWYVLTNLGDKLAARAVTLGPSLENDVVITEGLAPGEPVVVRDAYLLYHRNFDAQYTPPD